MEKQALKYVQKALKNNKEQNSPLLLMTVGRDFMSPFAVVSLHQPVGAGGGQAITRPVISLPLAVFFLT